MLNIRHLIYVSIYVCCLRLISLQIDFFYSFFVVDEIQNELYIIS